MGEAVREGEQLAALSCAEQLLCSGKGRLRHDQRHGRSWALVFRAGSRVAGFGQCSRARHRCLAFGHIRRKAHSSAL